jgi:alpha-tubulin suppressor-like RCC1 family protein
VLAGLYPIITGRLLSLSETGIVSCWKNGCSGRLPAGLDNVVGINNGADHAIALKTDGTIICWGAQYRNQCSVPTDILGMTGMTILL